MGAEAERREVRLCRAVEWMVFLIYIVLFWGVIWLVGLGDACGWYGAAERTIVLCS